MVRGWRWRRDAWLVGSVVLAVLIVGSAAWYGSRSGRSGPTSSQATSSAPSQPAMERLPRGRVGAAELVYACARGCRPVVRLVDGREFEVPTDQPSVRGVTLSPDGRWLGFRLGSAFVIRDLVGSEERRLGSRTVTGRLAAWAWSTDSSILLLAELADDQPVEFLAYNPADGRRTPATAWPGHEVVGVRSPLTLLTVRLGAVAANRVDVDLADEDGTVTGSFVVDASPQLRQEERVEPGSLCFVGTDGYEVVVVRGDDDEPAAVLRSAGPTGAVNRHDLPEPDREGRWSVLGVGDDGRAFVRHGQGRTAVWYLSLNGAFRPGRDLPGDAEVVTPGTARR